MAPNFDYIVRSVIVLGKTIELLFVLGKAG